MSATIKVKVTDEATPFLSRLQNGLKESSSKTRLNRFIAGSAESVVREHVSRLSSRRSPLRTSQRSHYAESAERVESSANAQVATVSFPRTTGLHRAFQSFVLTPKNGSKYLTIPVHPEAYRKRAREIPDLKLIPLTRRNVLILARIVRNDPEKLETFYVLKRRVNIQQDRSLMPSDEEFLNAAEQGAEAFIDNFDETA